MHTTTHAIVHAATHTTTHGPTPRTPQTMVHGPPCARYGLVNDGSIRMLPRSPSCTLPHTPQTMVHDHCVPATAWSTRATTARCHARRRALSHAHHKPWSTTIAFQVRPGQRGQHPHAGARAARVPGSGGRRFQARPHCKDMRAHTALCAGPEVAGARGVACFLLAQGAATKQRPDGSGAWEAAGGCRAGTHTSIGVRGW